MRILLHSGRAVAATLALTAAAGLTGCDTVKTNLLEAVNPSIIDPSASPLCWLNQRETSRAYGTEVVASSTAPNAP